MSAKLRCAHARRLVAMFNILALACEVASTLAGEQIRHVFLWRNDGRKMQDLNALVDPADPLKRFVALTVAIAINDASETLADGIDSRTGFTHAYFFQGTVLTLSPTALAFGSQKAGTTGPARSITVTNTSTAPVPINSVALAGANAGQFQFTGNCGKSLAGKAHCVVEVTFAPTSKGAQSAFLNVNGGGGGLRSVSSRAQARNHCWPDLNGGRYWD